MELDEIARRLQAVEGLDWSDIGKLFEEEKYGDFYRVGPVLVPTDFDTEGDKVHPEDREYAAEQAAVAEFLQHVVADMRALLDAVRS
ncbi:hypothetical protein MF672_010805 [Actinomadura sp. ATCC 31491]|uniref:Uncharacterized protein n=1 Tax=Actinomadura luzonensis TaxID=2805427 RepID=A0ABT0FQU6_9ACTN|nr:hypothetical protein [Actinomadura luzonensis]MCK2214276.1 hypothetical protein [Actinomadura luzonensis]